MLMPKRQDNYDILRELVDCIHKHPDLRFHQVLWCMGIVSDKDLFYEESYMTLRAIQKRKREGKW